VIGVNLRHRAGLWRSAAVLLVVLAGVTPASAAGTGGIEVTPIPGVVDGHQVTAFHVKVPSRGGSAVPFALRNTTNAGASARLYAAAATSDGHGGFSLGAAGSSPYVSMSDTTVTLKARELRRSDFRVHAGPDGRPGGTQYAAVVVEVRDGAVVKQAATLIYLQAGRTVPLPLLIVVLAVALLVIAATGVLALRRLRPRVTPRP
jgi:hypothetical protein